MRLQGNSQSCAQVALAKRWQSATACCRPLQAWKMRKVADERNAGKHTGGYTIFRVHSTLSLGRLQFRTSTDCKAKRPDHASAGAAQSTGTCMQGVRTQGTCSGVILMRRPLSVSRYPSTRLENLTSHRPPAWTRFSSRGTSLFWDRCVTATGDRSAMWGLFWPCLHTNGHLTQ